MDRMIIYFGFNDFRRHKRGVENVIEVQSKAAEEVSILYIFFDEKTKVFRWNNIICLSVKRNFLRFINLNSIIHYLYRKRKQNKILIHSHNFLMSFFLYKKTDLFTVHDSLSYQYKCSKRSFIPIFKIIERQVYRRCKMLHFVSNFSKSKSLFKQGKFVIIPNTTYLEQFVSSLPSRTDIDNYIFSVRSIEERARIDLLIEVAKEFQREGNDLKIIVAGRGPLLKHFRNRIVEMGLKNIELLGYISDNELIKYYQGCRLVIVLAEYGEGFGLPIIEGYMINKPVIASNRCAIPEIIINQKFLVENDTQDIIKKIEFAMNFKKENYRNFYNDNFCQNKIMEQYKIMYNSLFQ
jgi:glycosyltransferase involved in cell wall biosynthesis